MSDTKKLTAIRDLLESATRSLSTARKLLESLAEGGSLAPSNDPQLDASNLPAYKSGDVKIVEGVFTGEGMLAADGNIYSVPYNYASKSKLVQGSRLKAMIQGDGKILYKIIEEIPFDSKVGLITKDKDNYHVIVEDKTYRVLTAAVTYVKAEAGNRVSIRVPSGKDATFATIDSLLPA